MSLYKGRRKILSDYTRADLRDIGNLVTLLNSSRLVHFMNKEEIDYLINYRNGKQPILDKIKEIRPEINHKNVFNHAQMITRDIVGYFLGNPIQYIQSGAKGKDELDLLNKYVAYEDKFSVDKEVGEFQSICGTAFKIIYTDGEFQDEVPFEERSLNPATTYVVYENSVAERPLCGVTFYNIYDPDGTTVIGVKLYVYTDHGLYTIKTSSDTGEITPESEIDFSPYDVGGVPVIEYPNNIWRIGDWELCLGLMDAINLLQNGRLDDIDQAVQSLLVFINADVDKERYEEMRECGIVTLINKQGISSDVKNVTVQLDQQGMNLFSQEMEQMLYALIGIPDRNHRSGGGGDTGQAVELRDGWANLEIVARNKEAIYKKAEKKTLRIILKILQNTMGFKLSLLDVDIKFSRNKNNNLLVKTQSYQTLLGTKTLSPADCLTIVDLVSDVNEYITRGQSFWGEDFGRVIKNTNLSKTEEVIEQ